MKTTRTVLTAILLFVPPTRYMVAAGEAVAVYAPRSAYSAAWPEGKGVFILHLDTKTGKVISVSIAKSMGAEILDQSAVAGFKQWRFRPGPKSVRIPFEFTHRPESEFVHSSPSADSIPEPRKGDVIYAPRPEYPYKARDHFSQGRGMFILRVRPNGTAARVEIEDSTGAPLLDQAAIAAYSKWRFKPGRVTAVRIPTQFTMAGVRY
jgi:TonB family protein